MIAETNGSGNLTASYVYGLERIAMNRSGSVFTYATDGQGSVRQLTSSSGNVTDTYYYTAFGEELAKTGSTVNTFRYVGESWDVNAGWYYNCARWYSPDQGRFTSSDPEDGCIECALSQHKYQYANLSPISKSDPTGRFTLSSVMATIGISNILAAHARPMVYTGTAGKDAKV